MTTLLRPDTAPVPEGLSVSGYVCVGPDGAPYWPSALPTAEASMRACFGWPDAYRLHDLARAGWRCVQITLATPEASAPLPARPTGET